MTLPEVLLWGALRARPGGFKFRRQHPLDRYSLDFACVATRLGIEVDGEIHAHTTEHDAVRDARIAELEFRTLRVPARDVLSNLEGVVQMIVAACGEVS